MRCLVTVFLCLMFAAPATTRPVLNVGHRGASGLAPEHTFASYDLALKLGADYIEQDLQMTSDGVLIVMHDEQLDRTTDCTGLVKTHTLAEIKRCDAGSWFAPRFAGQRVPTLDEVFKRYAGRANFYIETKSPEIYPGMEEALLALMDTYGLRKPAASRWKVLIQSFSPESLIRIHELDPTLPLIQLLQGGSAALMKLPLISRYAVGIGPTASDVDAGVIADAHAACLSVHPYTVNEEADLRALVALGADGAFTNFPDRFNRVLGRTRSDWGRAPAAAAAAWRRCTRSSVRGTPPETQGETTGSA
jgi:glycerophosphoryl diester phosphodiesterase